MWQWLVESMFMWQHYIDYKTNWLLRQIKIELTISLPNNFGGINNNINLDTNCTKSSGFSTIRIIKTLWIKVSYILYTWKSTRVFILVF